MRKLLDRYSYGEKSKESPNTKLVNLPEQTMPGEHTLAGIKDIAESLCRQNKLWWTISNNRSLL